MRGLSTNGVRSKKPSSKDIQEVEQVVVEPIETIEKIEPIEPVKTVLAVKVVDEKILAKDRITGKQILSADDYTWAAKELSCEVASIKAVAMVESAGGGFQMQIDGTLAPLILFEAHIFGRLTGYRYNQTHPNISSRGWNRALYGNSLNQHRRLDEASKLDRNAALQSCSWGKFQLMGCEWEQNGYKSLQDFINAMFRSERDHLEGFVNFIKRKPKLMPAIQQRDWKTFAYYYNGPGYKKNNYDVKMEQWYDKLKKA